MNQEFFDAEMLKMKHYNEQHNIDPTICPNCIKPDVLRSLLAEITLCRSKAEEKKTEWGNGMSEYAIEARAIIMLCDHLLGFIQQ